MTDNNSDTSFFDGFDTAETVAAVATDEQPLSSDAAEQMGLTPIGEEETEEAAGEEENSDTDAEGEEDNSDADAEEEENSKSGEVKALNEEEVKKAETAIAAKKDEDEEDEEDEDKLYPVIDNSYDNMGACQVNITYSLLPTKGESTSSDEREVLVTVYDHDDPPLIRECRLQDLGDLPKIVKDMMTELAKTLPSRAEARAKEKQEEKEEREKRKARLAEEPHRQDAGKACGQDSSEDSGNKRAGRPDRFVRRSDGQVNQEGGSNP